MNESEREHLKKKLKGPNRSGTEEKIRCGDVCSRPSFIYLVGAEENFFQKTYLSSAAAPSRCLIISLVSRRVGPVCERYELY